MHRITQIQIRGEIMFIHHLDSLGEIIEIAFPGGGISGNHKVGIQDKQDPPVVKTYFFLHLLYFLLNITVYNISSGYKSNSGAPEG